MNGHLHSEDAFRAAETLGESIIVPIHYGAFAGTNDARGSYWRGEFAEGLQEQVLLLDVGESLPLDIRTADLLAEELLAPASE
jgi:L-ascorbate metabolism protein UlaG (beta-lactamase superfamily)